LRDRSLDIDAQLTADTSQRSQMRREYDADHGSV
jgi:hypothetical protein